MVLVDHRLAGREGGGQLAAGLHLEDDCAALLRDDSVVLVEDAGVLGDRVERDAERAERLAVHAVAVRSGDDVGPRRVDRRVDHERRPVHRTPAVDDLPVVVDEDEVADLHVAEALDERVDPEVVRELGVAHGDVSGDALAEAAAAEDAQRTGELLLAVEALLLDGGERRRPGEADLPGRQLHAVDRSGAGLGDGHASQVTAELVDGAPIRGSERASGSTGRDPTDARLDWYPIGYHAAVIAARTLQEARRTARLSLRALAARAGTSHATVSAYEHGAKVPSVATLAHLLEAAGFAADVRLERRIRGDELGDRGVELEAVLDLAGAFPARHARRLAAPAFPEAIAR